MARGRLVPFVALVPLLGACGEPPRTIALDHTVEPACDVTMSSVGTSTTARAGETVTIDFDGDRATATFTSTCTLGGAASSAPCDLDFGPNGTQTVRVNEGASATDLTVECPADRSTDAGPT